MPHRILFDVSAHGHGHLAQTARVVAAWRQAAPDVQLFVRSGLPRRLLEARLGPVEHVLASDTDPGLLMRGEVVVDREATRRFYQGLHGQYARHVADLQQYALKRRIDMICANAGYLAIDAARSAGIQSCLLCSLSWDEILAHLFPADRAMATVIATITQAYAQADLCFRLRPGMPMAALGGETVREVLGLPGRDLRQQLRRHLGDAVSPLVLFAFGDWTVQRPRILDEPGRALFIVPRRWMGGAGRMVCAEALPFRFRDLIASVDLVVSKTGYGIVTELALDNQGALLVERLGWPEEPHLLSWLRPHAWFDVLPGLDALTAGCLEDALRRRAVAPAGGAAPSGGEHWIVARLRQALAP